MNKSGLKGAYNFRDAGGYIGKDGRKVKHHLIYRSDELSKLIEDDVEKINQLGIKTIIDFRSTDERQNNEDDAALTSEIVYLTPVADIAAFASKEDAEFDLKSMKLTADLAKSMMIKQNVAFVEMEQCRKVFKEMLDIMTDEAAIPTLQHCRGGKDRTGYGIALILGILGVSDADIMHDYMLTNEYKKEKNEKSLADMLDKTGDEDLVLAMRYMKEATPEFLQTALDIINTKYGSIKTYVQTELGVTIEQIKKLEDLYLEKGD